MGPPGFSPVASPLTPGLRPGYDQPVGRTAAIRPGSPVGRGFSPATHCQSLVGQGSGRAGRESSSRPGDDSRIRLRQSGRPERDPRAAAAGVQVEGDSARAKKSRGLTQAAQITCSLRPLLPVDMEGMIDRSSVGPEAWAGSAEGSLCGRSVRGEQASILRERLTARAGGAHPSERRREKR